MTTFAPSATKRWTVARPMPEQPPVMTATRSWMRPATDASFRLPGFATFASAKLP